jgi:hypothetical protein
VTSHVYNVERLYDDQQRDFVIDAVPAMIAWLAATRTTRAPYRFEIEVKRDAAARPANEELVVAWNLGALAKRDPALNDRVRRLRSGRTPHREHATEVAAYGLALVAISALLPGRRVVAWARYVAPDLLFDATPHARRGVEVAGRPKGGRSALHVVRDGRGGQPGKAALLREDPEIAEAWLSLWCGTPTVSMMVHVKP